MKALTLTLLPGCFSIHRLSPNASIPLEALQAPFFSVTASDEELSLVLPEESPCNSDKVDKGWICFKVSGPLDFSLTGILASLANTLAAAEISIFAVSTFDTDYILVKKNNRENAIHALQKEGHNVLRQ